MAELPRDIPGENLKRWLARTPEAAIDPDQPIIDPHHHLWDRRPRPELARDARQQLRYLADDLVEDIRGAGQTYDPVSHYRARAVLGFFRAQGLDVPLLRTVSQAQLARLAQGIDALGVNPAVLTWNRDLPLERRGGFLALDAPSAGEFAARLRERGVFTDHRGPALRVGPAPYVTDPQLDEAIGLIGEIAEQ